MKRLLLAVLVAGAASAAEPTKPEELFQTTKVWNVHIAMTAQQFAAMTPRYAPNAAYQPGASRLQGPEGQRNGLSAARGIEFPMAHADLEFEGGKLADVGIRYKGNGTYSASSGTDKISLKVHLNEYVKGQKLAGVTTLNFHSGVTDNSFMSEVMSYRI